MGLGSILGSLSPAFGLLSGKGLFGSKGFGQALAGMSPLAMILGLGHHGGGSDAADAGGPPALPMGNAQPAPSLPGPSVGQVAASLPQPNVPQGPSTRQQLGQALMRSSGGGDYSAGLSALNAPGMGDLLARLFPEMI